MFIYEKGKSSSFPQIAEKHWEKLVNAYIYQKKVLKYRSPSIVEKTRKHLAHTDGTQHFFQDLAANNFKLLKKIIVGKPSDLQSVINDFESHLLSGRYPSLTEIVAGEVEPSVFAKRIAQVFNYQAFSKKSTSKKDNTWRAYELCELLSIDVCPYCNRNFTFTLKASDNGVVRPELDHFLPKSLFPYLALSFYNLIPSCHICNSNLKHAHEFDLENYLHPYILSLDSVVKFSIEFKGKDTLTKEEVLKHYGVNFFYGDADSFNITLKAASQKISDLKKAVKNIQVFRIKELYNRHKNIVQEIIQTSLVYNEDYIESLLEDYKGLLFRNREDVLRYVARNYPRSAEMPNKPFSKLSKDIYEEFGIKI